jgi:hypothetical protein
VAACGERMTAVKNSDPKLDKVVHTCNSCTLETKIGGTRISGHPGLHGKTLSQKKKKRNLTQKNNFHRKRAMMLKSTIK